MLQNDSRNKSNLEEVTNFICLYLFFAFCFPVYFNYLIVLLLGLHFKYFTKLYINFDFVQSMQYTE